MNISTHRLCYQLLRLSNTGKFVNLSKINLLQSSYNTQVTFITRTVLTRPKELDQLKKRVKERFEEKENKAPNSSSNEPIGLYGYLLLAIPVITFGLGTWQIGRREWKLKLIKDLEERMSSEPIQIPENLDDLKHLEYCPIRVRGEFLYDKEFVVGPRSLIVDGHGASEGKGNLMSNHSLNRGYNVITPFKLENRDLVILVNRGWLPNKYKYTEERKKCRMEGLVEFTGVNRLNEERPQFVPKNEPEKSVWHYRDIYQMANFAATEPIYLDMVESDPAPGMPIGSQTRVNLRNEHLSYIITWYGLSAITGFYWYRIFIRKRPIF